MKVLILGSGGREHAIYWKLLQSPLAKSIHVFPGNGGIPEKDTIVDSNLNLSDPASIVAHVKRESYDLVVIGPEQPLVDGIVDMLENIVPVFGPSRAAARLEGSKFFAKSFMQRYKIPTAAAESFSDAESAIRYIDSRKIPIVIKADGLAAGKGVTVAFSRDDAVNAVRDCLENGVFGASGHSLLVEDFMEGEEASVFAICDGEKALPFIAAQDHKRAFDGDRGPNTGGMGAYCPVAMMSPEMMERVQKEVLDPVIQGMKAEGSPYRGLLYAGLMIGKEELKVVEFNVRFGDPETQALLRLLDEDLLQLMYESATGKLKQNALRFREESAVVVVLAADGYPGAYKKNIEFNNLDNLGSDIICFHAGTLRKENRYLSNGGRVLGITATGPDMQSARKRVYEALKKIDVKGTFYRTDIGGDKI